jgi:hypothetical protein
MSSPYDRLIQALEQVQKHAVKQADADYVSSQALAMILMRTRRGQFLTAGSGTETRSSYSAGHKRKRQKLGLTISPVNLFMGEVGVLESIKSRNLFHDLGVTLQIGYLSGISEAAAKEIGGYLDTYGVGRNRVKFKHIGFTETEENRIVQFLAERVKNNISGAF